MKIFFDLSVSGNQLWDHRNDFVQEIPRYGHHSFEWITKDNISLSKGSMTLHTLYTVTAHTGDILTPPIVTSMFRAKTFDSAPEPTVDLPQAHT